MKNYLTQFVDEIEKYETNSLTAMPLIHTTSAFAFREILNNGYNLTPQPDSAFKGDKLLYFFYGKASYVQRQDYFSKLSPFFPVAYVINPKTQFDIARVFPFDSGAFLHKIYENYIPEKLKIDSFSVDKGNADIHSASKIVKAFYKSNENYYRNNSRNDINIDSLNFEVESYFNMIKSLEAAPFDERSSTIEIQVKNEIHIPSSTLAIILPNTFLHSKELMKSASKLSNVELIGYSTFRGNPAYFASLIIDRIGETMVKHKYLN